MAKRTGLPSLLKVAHRLCYLIVVFTPIIQKQYPNNDTLLAALATANAACQALGTEISNALPVGD